MSRGNSTDATAPATRVAREAEPLRTTTGGGDLRTKRDAANPTASAATSATGTALLTLTRLRASSASARNCIR